MLVVGEIDKLGLSHEVQVHKPIFSRRGVMVCFPWCGFQERARVPAPENAQRIGDPVKPAVLWPPYRPDIPAQPAASP